MYKLINSQKRKHSEKPANEKRAVTVHKIHGSVCTLILGVMVRCIVLQEKHKMFK